MKTGYLARPQSQLQQSQSDVRSDIIKHFASPKWNWQGNWQKWLLKIGRFPDQPYRRVGWATRLGCNQLHSWISQKLGGLLPPNDKISSFKLTIQIWNFGADLDRIFRMFAFLEKDMNWKAGLHMTWSQIIQRKVKGRHHRPDSICALQGLLLKATICQSFVQLQR